MTQKYMRATDQEPLEMENKEMSQSCDIDRSVLLGGGSSTAIDSTRGEHDP